MRPVLYFQGKAVLIQAWTLVCLLRGTFLRLATRVTETCICRRFTTLIMEYKGKAVPLQAWGGPEGSRKLRFPDFVTTAQDDGKVVSLRTGRIYPQEIHLVLISVRG
jgi:hypothetical protein